MKWLVIRHSIAMEKEEFQQIDQDDRLRPLTPDGIKKMRKNAQGLRAVSPDIDVLITSPLARALQTAEIARNTYALDSFLQTETLSPEAEFADFFEFLRSGAHLSTSVMRKGCVALVGHEPHLSGLITYALTGQSVPVGELRKGGACLIDFPHSLKAGEGHLQWWLTPKLMRGLV